MLFFFAHTLTLLHFDHQFLILQSRTGGVQPGHRGRQSDVPPQSPDGDHQFIALLK